MAEAMAEYTHKRIRAECGFAAEDAHEGAVDGQGYGGVFKALPGDSLVKGRDVADNAIVVQADHFADVLLGSAAQE